MFLRRLHTARPQEVILNVTPFVDILFLLIIFFILASRFVAPETFTVQIPDAIDQARNVTSTDGMATITLMRSPGGRTDCAIGSEMIAASDRTAFVDKLSTALDLRLALLPENKRIVALRIDKHIPYKDVQYVLAAVARSQASAVRLAALREKQP
jgi:biopolymer transport protein ExbD